MGVQIGHYPGDPVGLEPRDGPGSCEPDPADLRDQDPGPATVDLLDPQGLRPDDRNPPGRPVAHRVRRETGPGPRARPGSNRRARTRAAIARLKAREGDRRRDWIEKTSTDLAARFEVIRVEDLNVRGMTRSARGTVAEPGRNVRAKAGLNRGILASGWTMLVTRLEQKAPGRVEKVKAAYTSQRCSVCGSVDPNSRQSQARFVCTTCRYTGNADVNAARNIAAGHAVTARGDRGGSARSVKREPQHARPPKVA